MQRHNHKGTKNTKEHKDVVHIGVSVSGAHTAMILATDRKWRAVRLENSESITYLDGLLRDGWYLMELGVDGLATMAFQVPVKPPAFFPPRGMTTYSAVNPTFS